MNRLRPQLSATLSAILPLCLLWAFIACVALCLHHDEDLHASVAVDVLDHGCDADGCPIPSDTEFVTPTRQLNIPHAGEGPRFCPIPPSSHDGVYASASPRKFEATSPPASGPPHEGYCVLRI